MAGKTGELLFFKCRDGPWYPTLKLLHKCELGLHLDGLLFRVPFTNAHMLVTLGALKFSLLNKLHIYQCMGNLVWNFKEYLWNSTQNILPICWGEKCDSIQYWKFESSQIEAILSQPQCVNYCCPFQIPSSCPGCRSTKVPSGSSWVAQTSCVRDSHRLAPEWPTYQRAP